VSTDDPVHVVRRYIEAFNSGDVEAMAACFAASGAILDGMAPHLWFGPSAVRDWYRDVLVEGRHLNASGYHVTLGEPSHANVTGEAAYVVLPAEMRFRLGDAAVTQTGAVFTTALQRSAGGWRIVAWAWAKGRSAAG